MPNPFKYLQSNPTGLVKNWVSVTPNDTTDNVGTGNVAVALYVTTGGTVSWIDVDGNTTGPMTLGDGSILPGSFSRILSTGTSALGIWAAISA